MPLEQLKEEPLSAKEAQKIEKSYPEDTGDFEKDKNGNWRTDNRTNEEKKWDEADEQEKMEQKILKDDSVLKNTIKENAESDVLDNQAKKPKRKIIKDGNVINAKKYFKKPKNDEVIIKSDKEKAKIIKLPPGFKKEKDRYGNDIIRDERTKNSGGQHGRSAARGQYR